MTAELLIFVVFSVLFSFVCCDVIVPTKYGEVRGRETSNGFAFLGIPYSAPPLGNARWRAPVEPQPWSPAIYNATKLPPGCPQILCAKFLPAISCPNETAESCLFLNIWTPPSVAEKLPVMVFIHGGAFVFCDSSSLIWNGEHIAKMGQVIVVNMNYRLGLLGYLYTGDGPDDAAGNFGIQDQRLALKWVQENIANFGGDPNKVTLFGQSAGAQSTLIHMMSPRSVGLFHKAIVESAPSGVPYKDPIQAKRLAADVRALLRCRRGDTVCLRSKSVKEILDVQLLVTLSPTSLNLLELFENIGPVIDGEEVPANPLDAASLDKIRHYPVMIGTVSEEARPFVYRIVEFKLTKDEYKAVLLATYPSHFGQMYDTYPAPEGATDLRDTLSQLFTDFLFTCPTRNSSRNLIKHGDPSVFRYVFDHAMVYPSSWGDLTFCKGHVCHAAELPFVFNNLLNCTAEEKQLSIRMLFYWTNFAHTSDPNIGPNPDVPKWPANGQKLLKYFKTPTDSIVNDYRSDFCDFWDSVGYDRLYSRNNKVINGFKYRRTGTIGINIS